MSSRQRQLNSQYNTATATASNTRNHSSDMKRSAVKDLIERYFYQLQRGCGNPKCSNVNCASSGKVAAMTPNEIAAKAIQLFSQDAKLCESYTQPPKVPRTGPQHESPTSSSRSASHDTSIDLNEAMDSYSPRDHSSGGSSNSTITSGTSTSSSSTGSSNTNISSCATEEMPLLVALGEVAATGSATDFKDTDASTSSKAKTSDPPTPTLAPLEYLNEQIVDEIIEDCKKTKNYDRLINAINDVYCSVKKLSKSFRRPPLAKLTSTATASKLQEILGKSPQELKKEDLRTLEGEHDKDEDSTCMEDEENVETSTNVAGNDLNVNDHNLGAGTDQVETIIEAGTSTSALTNGIFAGTSIEPMDEDANSDELDDIVEWSHSCDTQVDFESLRRVKKKLYGLKKKAVREAINENIVLLAESVKYGRFYDWEKVLHCLVICFDMYMTCK